MAANKEDDAPRVSAERLREMRKHLRQSRVLLGPQAAFGAVVTAAGVPVVVWSGCSRWAWLVLAIMAWHGFAGDLINVLYLGRRVAVAERADAKLDAASD